MDSKRRDYLRLLGRGSLGLALGGDWEVPAVFAAHPEIPRLREIAASRGLLYGSDSDAGLTGTPEVYRGLFQTQCALYAPVLGWKDLSPRPDVYIFAPVQPSIDFATSAGLRMTGAHLLWHEQLPDWFVSISNAALRGHALTRHVSTMCRRFAGRVFAWNVVNEALSPASGRASGLRDSPVGPEDFVIAFKAARAADPQALLVYNDYALELDTARHASRRVDFLGLVDWLLDRGAPIDAVGLQSHLKFANFKFDPQKYRKFLHDIAARGLRIIVTEMDVLDKGAVSDIKERDRLVANIYSRYLSVVLDEPAVCGLVTWGLSDRYTWLNPVFSKDFARPDGLPTRPLPFDSDFQPKPAFFSILKALTDAPERQMAQPLATKKVAPGLAVGSCDRD